VNADSDMQVIIQHVSQLVFQLIECALKMCGFLGDLIFFVKLSDDCS